MSNIKEIISLKTYKNIKRKNLLLIFHEFCNLLKEKKTPKYFNLRCNENIYLQ